RYALWLLVFVKLLIPPGLSAPWAVGNVAQRAAAASGYSGISVTLSPAPVRPIALPAAVDAAVEASAPPVAPRPAASPIPATSLHRVLFAIWFAVTAAIFAAIVTQYIRFRRR